MSAAAIQLYEDFAKEAGGVPVLRHFADNSVLQGVTLQWHQVEMCFGIETQRTGVTIGQDPAKEYEATFTTILVDSVPHSPFTCHVYPRSAFQPFNQPWYGMTEAPTGCETFDDRFCVLTSNAARAQELLIESVRTCLLALKRFHQHGHVEVVVDDDGVRIRWRDYLRSIEDVRSLCDQAARFHKLVLATQGST